MWALENTPLIKNHFLYCVSFHKSMFHCCLQALKSKTELKVLPSVYFVSIYLSVKWARSPCFHDHAVSV